MPGSISSHTHTHTDFLLIMLKTGSTHSRPGDFKSMICLLLGAILGVCVRLIAQVLITFCPVVCSGFRIFTDGFQSSFGPSMRLRLLSVFLQQRCLEASHQRGFGLRTIDQNNRRRSHTSSTHKVLMLVYLRERISTKCSTSQDHAKPNTSQMICPC